MLFLLLALAGGALFVIYSASRHQPKFYQRALLVEPEVQREEGDALEKNVLQLHNTARNEGRWEAVFTESQINGWLAADLPEKFPHILPAGTDEPRVAIGEEEIKIACRYQRGKVNTIISFDLIVNLTSETNTLAVRVSKVRAGALPVPLKRFLTPITRVCVRSGITLRWTQIDGDPVALVTIPHEHEDYAHREIYLEAFEMRDGEIVLAGRTQKTEEILHTVAHLPEELQTSAGTQSDSGSSNVTIQR
jgi:hypothetical protein